MVVYNITGLVQNVTSLEAFISVSNDASNGLLVGLFMLSIFVVLFVSFMRFDFLRALAGSGFICLIVSGFLVYLDWLNIIFMLGFLLITAGSGFLLYLQD